MENDHRANKRRPVRDEYSQGPVRVQVYNNLGGCKKGSQCCNDGGSDNKCECSTKLDRLTEEVEMLKKILLDVVLIKLNDIGQLVSDCYPRY